MIDLLANQIVANLAQIVAAGTILTVIAAFVIFAKQRRHRLEDATLSLYEKFQAPDMLSSRINADRILQRYKNDVPPPKLHAIAKLMKDEEWEHISRVRHFLAQIQMLREAKAIDMKLCDNLFGAHVVFWFGRYFEEMEDADDITPHWRYTRPPLIEWMQRLKSSTKSGYLYGG
jgi:hypothetical protein